MTEPAVHISEWLGALRSRGCNPKREGNGWRASCPTNAHEGRNKKNPALHIEEAKGGKVLATCHAGCDFDDVRAALGLDPRPSNGTARTPRAMERSAPARAPATARKTSSVENTVTSRFPYHTADGAVLVTIARRDGPDGKKVCQPWREPKGVEAPPGGYPLYRLPSLLANADKPLLVVEGEKTAACAQDLFGDRYEATTSIGGSGSAAHSDWTPARGRAVYIWPDADTAGARHADEVARLCHEVGATTVLRVRTDDLPDKWDLADWSPNGLDIEARLEDAVSVPPPSPLATGQHASGDALDDKRVALYLAQEWTDSVANTCGLGWFVCGDDGLWDRDPLGVQVRKQIRRVLVDSGIAKPNVKTRDVERELADELNVASDEWNAGDVLGLPDGRVVDLATGETRAAYRHERVYQRLAVVPEEGEPTEWLRVLDETFAELAQPDKVIEYVRWWLRYSLGVSCHDESILFLQGPPGSGKSTICDVWTFIAGDYAATREGKRLAGHTNQHSQWLAGLVGKRLVRVGELPDNGQWDTGPINALASGETVEANLMRQNSIEFQSVSKLLITSNHKLRANSQSGLFRRLRVVECRHVADPPDEGLKARLRCEAGMILRWVLDAGGRPEVPADIRNAGAAYQAEADALGDWLDARAVLDPNEFTPTADLWRDYRDWAEVTLTPPLGKRRFDTLLTEKFGPSFPKRLPDVGVAKCRAGIKLRRG